MVKSVNTLKFVFFEQFVYLLMAALRSRCRHYIFILWFLLSSILFFPRLISAVPPFPQIDIIGAVVIVWRVRGKTIRSVLCNIVCNNCAQCSAHTYEQTNSSLDWVLSHWAHFTVLDSFLYCVLLCVVCMMT